MNKYEILKKFISSNKIMIPLDDPVDPGYDVIINYVCDRDPTTNEPLVYNNLPGLILIWQNTTTDEYFICADNTSDAMIWQKFIVDSNIASELSNLGWKINTNRNYSSISSPAFNTSYSPSLNNDTFITATVEIVLSLLESSTVQAQVNTGSGFVTVAIAAPGGVAITDTRTLSFIVPAGATYKIVSSGTGTNTLNSLMELSL